MSNSNSNYPSHSNAPLDEREQALFDISERILEYAREANCSAADLSINQLSGSEFSVRNGEPETIERNQDKGLQVRVFKGHQTGSASTTDFSDAAIRSTVNAAASIAKVTQGDDCLELADQRLYPSAFLDLKLNHAHQMDAQALGEFALEQAKACEAAAQESDARITNTEGANFSAHEGVSLTRNSNGFIGFSRGTRYGLSCSVIAGKQDNMQRDYWYDSARKLSDLESAESIGLRAAERTLSRMGAQKMKTCRAPILFDATIAPGFIGHLISGISGSAIYKKSSFLAGQIDQMIFPSRLNISQDPHRTLGMGSAVYDSDGVATSAQHYIEDGRLVSYVLGQYSACKLGLQTTGNAGGVYNISVSHDDIDQAALIRKMDKGLLVTEMMGFGVNMITGDYSRGAAGFWVEKGVIQYPVHEITISGKLQDMFKGLQGIANDVNTKGNIQCGSILLDEMTIAGN